MFVESLGSPTKQTEIERTAIARQVINSGLENINVIMGSAQQVVTIITEQTSCLPIHVIVVEGGSLIYLTGANCPFIALLL
jgi:hypothetical protein